LYPEKLETIPSDMSEKQRTIANTVSLKGKGLHSGIDVNITFRPAPANHGYKFCRTDLPGAPLIDALADHVTNIQGDHTGAKQCFCINY